MKIIPLREFLSTADEIHSFIIGWCEAIYPLQPIKSKPAHVNKMIDSEYHYYSFGLALGTLTWVGIIIGAISLISIIL